MTQVLPRPAADVPAADVPVAAPLAAPRIMGDAVLDAGNLADRVHLRLRDAMMRGELRPHQRLKPRDIATALRISETPVREALQRLAQEGLVEFERRRSMRVRRLTLDEYLELRDMREPLETLAATRAMPALRESALPELRRLHAAVTRARTEGDWAAARQANFDFHFTIYRHSAMPALITLLETMWARSGSAFAELFACAPPCHREPHPHVEVLAAIAAGDAEALGAAIRRDMHEGATELVALLMTEQADGAASGVCAAD